MKVSVFAPASIGNVSIGFDVLGMSVRPVDGTLLGDVVTVESSSSDQLVVIGEFADKLPQAQEDNIVWQCLLLFNQELALKQVTARSVCLTLDKKMPVGSGLGSSACSVVATLDALNQYYQQVFSERELLRLMGLMEAQISGSLHYDNVAPCYLGGLQLMLPDEAMISQTLPGFNDCYYIMAYPGITVSTKAAREVLPTDYGRSQLIQYGQRLAAFVDACHRQDVKQAFSVFEDVVAEPYRRELIPGYQQAKDYLLAQGAVAAGISGSGPTLFCVCQEQSRAQELALWLKENYLKNDLGFVHVCQLDQHGSSVLQAADAVEV